MPRQLKCPRCAQVNVIADGAKPACAKCGFGTAATPSAAAAPVPQFQRQATPGPRQATGIHYSTIVATALFGLALVAMVLIQFSFLPFSAVDENGVAGQYGTWGRDGEALGGTGPESYWDAPLSESNGAWMLQAAGPLLLASMAAVVMAAVGVLLNKRGLANNLGWVAASVGASMVIVLALGVQAQQDEAFASFGEGSIAFSWAAGFYVAIAAVALIVVGTLFAAMRVKAPQVTGQAVQRPL